MVQWHTSKWFFYFMGTWKLCAVNEARTHAKFGETDIMNKSYIFSTRPSIYRRKSLKGSIKPRNELPYLVNHEIMDYMNVDLKDYLILSASLKNILPWISLVKKQNFRSFNQKVQRRRGLSLIKSKEISVTLSFHRSVWQSCFNLWRGIILCLLIK